MKGPTMCSPPKPNRLSVVVMYRKDPYIVWIGSIETPPPPPPPRARDNGQDLKVKPRLSSHVTSVFHTCRAARWTVEYDVTRIYSIC